eukprot:TRINITY_DN20003_c0_g1_i1.p1 TRINITY_DN20003_c0_g1~~TRINITY_DN20003_c0_g1_i1.p1  ORF type:complete len:146 (+),score=0.86 TRINITY_DN20003_c0_g1_i1:85-522(+)
MCIRDSSIDASSATANKPRYTKLKAYLIGVNEMLGRTTSTPVQSTSTLERIPRSKLVPALLAHLNDASLNPAAPTSERGVIAALCLQAICTMAAPEGGSVLSFPNARPSKEATSVCLLYTSDAADEEDSVDLGGRRIIEKKKISR